MCPIQIEFETCECKGLSILRDIHVVTEFGSRVMPICSVLIAGCACLHPYSPTSRHGSPRILDLTVSLFNLIITFLGFQNGPDRVSASKVGVLDFFRSTDIYRLNLMRPRQWMSPMTPYRHFGGLLGGCAAPARSR